MELLNRITDGAARFFQTLEGGKPSLLNSLKRRGGYAVLNRLIGRAVPFASRNGFEVVEMRSGYLKASIALHGNKNHIGTMYAGAMFVLAEIPGGVLSYLEFGTDYFPILKELTISYRKPSNTDVTVEFVLPDAEVERIREEADRNGKSNFTLTGDLYDANGELVAQAKASYQLRKNGWYCGAA